MKIHFRAFCLSLCVLGCTTASLTWAEDPEPKAEAVAEAETPASSVRETSPQLEGVDIPTADVLDPKTFSTSFRFYSEGGIASRLVLGPFRRLNLGFYLDAQNMIGSGEPHLIRPSVFIKLRFFDGTDFLPALAAGYDNQGYIYQKSAHDFLQPAKGLYLVGSHDIFIEDFSLHAGINFTEIEDSGIPHGFFGATWKIVSSFALMAEYDNIQDGPENRLNLGGRFWVTPFFNIDLAARNVGRDAIRGAERIVQINYVIPFPF